MRIAKTKDAAGLFHYHFPSYPIETRSLTEGDANISSELLEPTCPHHLPPSQHPVVESQATLSFHMGAGNSNMALHAYTNKYSLMYGGVSSALDPELQILRPPPPSASIIDMFHHAWFTRCCGSNPGLQVPYHRSHIDSPLFSHLFKHLWV